MESSQTSSPIMSPEKKEKNKMDSDQILSMIGDWGRWQRKYVIVLGLLTFFGAWPSLIITFMAPPMEFVCLDKIKSGNLSSIEFGKGNQCEVEMNESNETKRCNSFIYDHSDFTKTIIDQWDLVCDRAPLKDLAQSLYFAGMMIGVISIGHLSDHYGRKTILVPITLGTVLIGSILPFSPNIETFMALRFMQGSMRVGIFTLVFVWSMEVVGGKWKTYVGIGLEFPWVMAWLLISLFGYLITDWRILQWITSIPGLTCIALFWWLPESPKWLLTVGKTSKAEVIVRQAAQNNDIKVPDDWKLYPIVTGDQNVKKGNFLDLFKTRRILIKSVVLFINWFANSFVYYGLTLNSGNIGGSYRLNFFINGCLEIPCYAMSLWIIHKGGRKWPYIMLMLFGGIVLVSTTLIPKDTFYKNWPIVVLAMVGKFCLSGSYAILYVYSAEIFPTVVRSVGVGSSSVFARIGGTIAPFVGSLDKIVDPTFPIMIFGVTSLIAGILVFFLPETKDKKIPDTLEEADKFLREEMP